MQIVAIRPQGVTAQTDRPQAARLVTGNPLRHTWPVFDSAAGQVAAGIWACEPGAWRIVFAEDKYEFFAVIEGRVRLSDEQGVAQEFGPGEAAVIPAGFRGEFRVLQAVRKYYVIVSGVA